MPSKRATLNLLDLTKTRTSLELQAVTEAEKIGSRSVGRGWLTWRGGKR